MEKWKHFLQVDWWKNWNQKERNYIVMNQSIPAVFIPLGVFSHIVSLGGGGGGEGEQA